MNLNKTKNQKPASSDCTDSPSIQHFSSLKCFGILWTGLWLQQCIANIIYDIQTHVNHKQS